MCTYRGQKPFFYQGRVEVDRQPNRFPGLNEVMQLPGADQYDRRCVYRNLVEVQPHQKAAPGHQEQQVLRIPVRNIDVVIPIGRAFPHTMNGQTRLCGKGQPELQYPFFCHTIIP